MSAERMAVAYAAACWLTVLFNGGAAVADLARARFVLANAADVNVPLSWLPALGALKGAGAAGVLLGLLGVAVIGELAAAGLVLFFLGAVGAHVRERAYRKIGYPLLFLVLAAVSLLGFIAA